MAIEAIELDQIHDNPHQARSTYHRKDIDDLAHSIKTHGLLQVPPGRRKDGNIELGFGHLRKRAFLMLAKKEPQKWGKMPVDIRELSDDQMAMFALEENLKRRDITPIEIARAVDNYLNSFPGKTEVKVAEYLNMTKGNVSNMRRVLRLPEQVLEKIDEGRINFHQGRELIIMERLTAKGDVSSAKELMLTAIRSIRTEGRPYGHANTVEGMQKAVHEVINNHCRPLDKEYEGYRWDLIFDTRAIGCLQCDKMIRTHPTKSGTAHYCLDDKCWDSHQEDQRETAAAEAKAKMEADILRRAAEQSQEIPASCQDCPTVNDCIGSAVWQTYKGNPACPNRGIKPADTDKKSKQRKKPVVADDRGIVIPLPCDSCANADSCDRTYFHVATDGSGQLVCEKMVKRAPEEVSIPTPIPKDILAMVREKAGTRARVLDLKEIGAGYYQDVAQGYALLDGVDHLLKQILDPEECLERCTHGFHYAFDSRQQTERTRYVCSDTKCLSKKKSAFTREKHAEGQARKNAERKAIKEAIAQTTTLDRPRINLIILAQMNGLHAGRPYYYGDEAGTKRPETWLWDKLSAGTPAIERNLDDLFKRIDKLTDEELAKLVVEFMFYYLVDHGDIGSYEIKAIEPLKWMGIPIITSEEKEHA